MIFENRTLNLIWGILFFGGLWLSFGFIFPIVMIMTGKTEGIIVGIICMLFSHSLTIIYTQER
jgi:hypothetical protein